MTEESPWQGPALTFCATHPEVETALACGKCGKPICPRCLIHTPVGARCRECAQLRRLPIFEVAPRHYALAGAVGLGIAGLSGLVWAFLPRGGFFGIIIALGVGYVVGEAISYSVNRKRSLGLQIIAGSAVFLSYWVSLLLPPTMALLEAGAAVAGSGVLWSALVISTLISILANPFAWLIVGAGVFMAVIRLR